MRAVNCVVGVLLLGFAVLHFGPAWQLPAVAAYCCGGVLAFISLRRELGMGVSRVLAVVTTALMFFYFAGFFTLAPELQQGWYANERALVALSLLFAAFSMIPVLSEYSCRLKADCHEARRRAGFFSVPQELENG